LTSKKRAEKHVSPRRKNRILRRKSPTGSIIESMGWGLEGQGWQNNSGGAFNTFGYIMPLGGMDNTPANQCWSVEQWCYKIVDASAVNEANQGLRARKISLLGTYTQAMQAPSGSPTILPIPLTPYISMWQVVVSGGAPIGTGPANPIVYTQANGDTDDCTNAEGLAYSACGSSYPIKAIEKLKYCSVRPIDWYGGTLPAISGSANAEIVSYRIQAAIKAPAKWHKGFHATDVVEAEYSNYVMMMVRFAIPAQAGYYGPNWTFSGRTRMQVKFESQRKTISDVLA